MKNRKNLAVARRRRRREGMTLVEIMIVVIIMALIAAAVGVAVLPQLTNANIRATQADAQSIQSAVTLYIAQDPGSGCPDVSDLVEAGVLDRTKRTTDAWNNDFVIECDGDVILVSSPGQDGQMGTEDDVLPR